MEWNWNWSQFIKQKSEWLGIWRLTWCNRRENDVAGNGVGLSESLVLVLALPITTCVAWASPLWKLLFTITLHYITLYLIYYKQGITEWTMRFPFSAIKRKKEKGRGRQRERGREGGQEGGRKEGTDGRTCILCSCLLRLQLSG